MLQEFITIYRDEIISRCRAKVAKRMIPPPTDAEINHGVPLFLDQLVETLQSGLDNLEMDSSAGKHGHDLLHQGFTVSQVVYDYGDVCQTITELAIELDMPIGVGDFQTLNRCLDNAIAGAVTVFTREREQSCFNLERDRGNERVGFLVHELRNLVNTASFAFEILQTGNVGASGHTSAVVSRSLAGLRDLIARSLDDVRLTHSMKHRTRIVVSDLIGEVEAAATLLAHDRGMTLSVMPVDAAVAIDGDRYILSAVVMNLLQNAFKFSRPQGAVTLRVVAGSTDRVLVEIEDECGGLPVRDINDLFRPFEQRGADRSGVGLGLAFSRWGAEANGGRLYARNLPGKGCVFTLDLPRSLVSDAALA